MSDKNFREIDVNDLRDLDHLFRVKNNTAGKVIKAFRNNFDISQRELCEITGINEKNLSAIENNRREIGIHTAKKIAAFFGIDPGSILFPNGLDTTLGDYGKIRRMAGQLFKQKKTGT